MTNPKPEFQGLSSFLGLITVEELAEQTATPQLEHTLALGGYITTVEKSIRLHIDEITEIREKRGPARSASWQSSYKDLDDLLKHWNDAKTLWVIARDQRRSKRESA